MDLKSLIRSVPDFPKKGIVFRDITTLLRNGPAFDEACGRIAAHFRLKKPDVVVGVEARGFILGAGVALKLGVGVVPIRKKGKLPHRTHREEYALEYGVDVIEMHRDAIEPGWKCLLVEDLIATGGTAHAAVRLIEKSGGTVTGCGFLIDLAFLKGAQKLAKYDVISLITYDAE